MGIKIKSPSGSTSVCLEGKMYEGDKKGVIEVPEEYENTIYSLGFIVIGKNIFDESPSPAETKGAVDQTKGPGAK